MSGMLGWTLVLLSVVVATIFLLRSRRRQGGPEPQRLADQGAPKDLTSGRALASEGNATPQMSFVETSRPIDPNAAGQQHAQTAPAAADDARERELLAKITVAEAARDNVETAGLYIHHAKLLIEAGRRDEGASRLRDAVRVAALNRLAAPHALARLELGDLYLSNGDPITACEQWQIARNLFHDLARPVERDAVDKRMLGNGCPTDWVLTDF